MSWNSDIFVTNECRLCDWYTTLLDIVNATNERCDAADEAALSTDIRLNDKYSVMNGIQDKITNLITLYVNHQTSGGDYDGDATIPMWDEADILTAISAGSRLEPTRLYSAQSWCMQQYQIINLLRWMTKTVYLVYGVPTTRYAKTASGVDWATCESNFSTLGWTTLGSGSGGTPSDEWIWLQKNKIGSYFKGGRKSDFSGGSIGGGLYQHSYDIYMYTKRRLTLDWFAWDIFVTEDRLFNAYNTILEQANPPNITIHSPDSKYHASVPAPIDGTTDRNVLDPNVSFYVAKFDGANGFAYRDW